MTPPETRVVRIHLVVPFPHAWNQVCEQHDWDVCECEKIYTNAGKTPPNTAAIATRSVVPSNTDGVDPAYMQ